MTATLAIHCGGVGDFVLTLPALRHLADAGPLDLAGYPERLALAVAGGIARRAFNLDDLDFHSAFSQPSDKLREVLRGYGRVAVWMKDEDGQLSKQLAQSAGIDLRVFPPLPPDGWPGHAMDYFAHCVGAPHEKPILLSLPPGGYRGDLLIQPGSGSAGKNWPIERYQALSRSLVELGHEVAWVLGPAEAHLKAPPGCAEIRETPLAAIGQALQGAGLFIGNDSGITHLAAAVGCPTLAIFGPTDAGRWGPVGPNVRVLAGTPWPTLEEVLEAAREAIRPKP